MATTSITVATVEDLESSEHSSESSPLRSLDVKSEPLGFCTSCGALTNGSDDTERGRQSYDAGMRRALVSYINSPLMENLSLEITILRAVNEATAAALKQCQWERDFWQRKFVDCVRQIGSKKNGA